MTYFYTYLGCTPLALEQLEETEIQTLLHIHKNILNSLQQK